MHLRRFEIVNREEYLKTYSLSQLVDIKFIYY